MSEEKFDLNSVVVLKPDSTDETTYCALEHDVTLVPQDRSDQLSELKSSREIYVQLKFAESIVRTVLEMPTFSYTSQRTSRNGQITLMQTRHGAFLETMLRNFPWNALSNKALSAHLDLLRKLVDNLGSLDAFLALPGQSDYAPSELKGSAFLPRCRAGFIKRLVHDLVQQGATPEFRKILKAADQRVDFVLQKMVKVIRNLFEAYACLSIIRIDLEYRQAVRNTMTIKTAKNDIRKFLNYLRHRKDFKHLVGHIWKLEMGVLNGLHFHCLFFFDGSEAKADIFHSMSLGKYWEQITAGRGIFHSCNAKKSNYRFLGIGKVTHADAAMHKTLYDILVYLAKSDQALSAPGERTFGYSKPVKPTAKSLGGRPRNDAVLTIFTRPTDLGDEGSVHE